MYPKFQLRKPETYFYFWLFFCFVSHKGTQGSNNRALTGKF